MKVASIVRHSPETLRWILTRTFRRQAANPSLTLTCPRATRCLRSASEMVRSWGVGRTVKSVALVPVPLAFVTVIGPVLAPVGTTAVI